MALDDIVTETLDWEELGARIRQAVDEATELRLSPTHVRGRVSPARHGETVEGGNP